MKNAKTFFKKALSLFVATLMLLSMCSLCFGVLAEEADYVVEYNNPALPMRAQSTIDLSKVSVEFTEGNAIDGSKINWSTYNEAVQIDNAAKTLTIYAEGTYELYASYNGVGKTVVAVVIPADAEGDENGIYEAEIFEYDFTNGTWDDFKKDWLLQRKLSNVSSFLAPAAPQISDKTYSTKGFVPFVASYNDEAGQTVRNCVYYVDGTRNIGYMYLKAGNIVENFSDYNVYATGYLGQLAFSGTSSSSGSGTSRAGILGRAVLNKDGVLDYKSDYQAALTSIVNYGSYTIDGVSAHFNAYMTGKACMVWDYDSKTSSYYGSNVNGIVAGNLYTVYAKYDGNTITTGLTKGDYETATAFAERAVDSECTQTYRNVSYVAGENGLCVEQSGTVGFMYNGAETQLQKFRVTHNIDLNNMPATLVTEPVNYFTVDSELPYFVMYENTTVDLSKFIVTIEGTGYVGNQVTWSTKDTGITIDAKNSYLTCGSYGDFTITATKGDISTDIYLYVIKEGDTEVNIIDYDFTVGSWEDWSKDWGIQVANRSTANSTLNITWFDPIDTLPTSTYDYAGKGIKGIVPFITRYKDENGTYVNVNTLNSHKALGIMYSKNPLIAKMSDYKLTAKSYIYERGFSSTTSTSRSSGSGAAGLIGRIELNNGVVTTDSRYQGYAIGWKRGNVTNFTATLANGTPAASSDLVKEVGFDAFAISKGVYGHSTINPGQFAAPDGVGGGISDTEMHEQYVTYQSVYSGGSVTVGFGLDDTIDADTATITDTAYRVGGEGYKIHKYNTANDLGATNVGTVGYMFFGIEEAVQNFKATIALDTTRIPETVEPEVVNYFTVDSELPYFVMCENTSADLSKFIVELAGKNYYGNELTWSTKDANITLDAENYYVTCGTYGDATLTVTNGTDSADIYLYVIKEGDTEVNIIDYDFTVGSWEDWSKDWGIQVANRSGANSTLNITWFDPIDTLPTSTYDYAGKGIKGIVPFITRYKDENGTNVNVNTYNSHKALGIMYSKNPLIAKMSDYKLTAKSYIYERGFSSTTSTSRSSGSGAAGLIGRIELNNGVVTTASRYQGYAIGWKRGNVTNFTATLANGTPAASSDLVKEVGFDALAISKGVYGHIDITPGQFAAPDGVGGGISDTEMHEQYVTYQSVYSGGSVTVGFGLDDTIDADTATITNTAYRVGGDGYKIHKYNTADDLGATNVGTVGYMFFGIEEAIQTFKASVPLEEERMPEAITIVTPEEPAFEGLELGVNEVVDLADYKVMFKGNNVAGSEITWSAAESTAYELNGTKLYTFAEADFELTATYDGVSKTISVSVKAEYKDENENAQDMIVAFDGGSLTISKYAYGKYVIDVNADAGYILKAGSLKVNVGGNTINVTSRANAVGTSFGFAAESIDGAVISAEFIKDTAADIAMLGGTIRLATETLTSGIRFGGRVSNIKSAKLTDTIVIDGKEYKTLGVGTLMLPSPLLEGELTVDTENVANKAIKKVVDATENYADVAFTLTGIPEGKMRDIKISVRTYVMYEDENGDAQYYYSDVVARSYNEVYDIVYPTVDNAGDIDKIVTVENTNFSGHNKEFAFNLKINGRYTVNYVLNDKDGNQVASGVISSLKPYNQYAKITALGEKIGAYQLILTAKDVDLAGRKNTTDLVGTYTIQVYDEDILISDTQRYLNQQTYAYGNTKGEGTTYLKFTVMSDQHYAWSSYGDGNNTYMNTRRNFAEALNKSDTEFVFMAGDNVDWALSYSGNGNIDTNKNLYVLQEALAPLTQKDIYAVYGNHDTQTPDFAKNLVINAGNVTIIAFTATYQELPSTGTRSTCIVPDSTIEWLKEQSEAALERNPDTHLVFINHYAIQNNTEKFAWPMLYDGDADLAAKKVETLNRNKLLDVITQYGVELYINGHEHNENMNFEEITYENGLGTGCINYNAGWSPTDITIEEYVDANGEIKLHVTAEQYKYDSFTSKVDDVSNKVNATVEFDLISNGLTAEETLANAEGFYAADAALRAEYSGKYNDLYSYSFEFAGVETVDGVKCYKFNVSRLLYYIDGSTVVYDAAVTEKKGILRETLKTVYISGDGTIVK